MSVPCQEAAVPGLAPSMASRRTWPGAKSSSAAGSMPVSTMQTAPGFVIGEAAGSTSAVACIAIAWLV